jgi:hypothetical protein
LIELPKGAAEPTKYWRSAVPEKTVSRLIDLAKLRWRIERDYQDLKQEVGLGNFEGRVWRGFHHHATLCIAAYGFLISERETISPSTPRSTVLFQVPDLPDGWGEHAGQRAMRRAAQTAQGTPCPQAATTPARLAVGRTRKSSPRRPAPFRIMGNSK